MPRRRRIVSPTGIYHWITRGIHRQKIFHDDEDFLYYLKLIKEVRIDHPIELYHYCLMDNHIHMLIYCADREILANFSHFLNRQYAYHYSKKYKWIGKVFQGRYKDKPITDEKYLLECARYIERNPLDAVLVQHPLDYVYSSYKHYAGLKTDELIPDFALEDQFFCK